MSHNVHTAIVHAIEVLLGINDNDSETRLMEPLILLSFKFHGLSVCVGMHTLAVATSFSLAVLW